MLNATQNLGGNGTDKSRETQILDPLKYLLFYNHSDGFHVNSVRGVASTLTDVAELITLELQADLPGIKRFTVLQWMLGIQSIDTLPTALQDKLLLLVSEFSAQEDYQTPSHLKTISDITDQMESVLLQGRAMVVVPHSQGNFYANEVVERLDARRSQNTNTFDPSQLNFAHFAVPAPRLTPYTRSNFGNLHGYLTWTGDRAMNRTREVTGISLPANYDDGLNYLPLDPGQGYVKELNITFFGGHNFQAVYFGRHSGIPGSYNPEKVERPAHTLFPLGQSGRSLIRDALLQVVPTDNRNGPITATLSWDKPGDVDLHTLEPDGHETYFADRQGGEHQYGQLDRDDQRGIGPEHYFSSCNALVEGTFRFGVLHYADPYQNGAKTATLTLSVFGRSQPPTKVVLPDVNPTGTPVALLSVRLFKKSNGDWDSEVQRVSSWTRGLKPLTAPLKPRLP